MKLGITRWKMVPSYSETPCFLAWEVGLVQSLVPSARPMKLATPIGAFSGNNLQVSLPALVSMTAVGSAETGFVSDHSVKESKNTETTMNHLRIGRLLKFDNSGVNRELYDNELYDKRREIYLPARAWACWACMSWLTLSTSRKTRTRLPPRILRISS